ncbi:MAG: hypothetical protein CMJ78_13430 [Planctomycetaceae bacterium]|nr:hypothetical protein [Planctomycetaceae bacterium]
MSTTNTAAPTWDQSLFEKCEFDVANGVGANQLWTLFRQHRGRLTLTYTLFNIENLLRLAQPFVLGLAINDLLNGTYFGLGLFIVQHIAHLTISSCRQMYDTRVYSQMYTSMATNVIVEQRSRDVNVSAVAARSALSRQFIEFFERSVPLTIRSAYSIVGALIMLTIYDPMLLPLCLVLLIPAALINRVYARQVFRLSGGLHDTLENEVDVIEPGSRSQVREHFATAAGWRIKLSDTEAINFCLMELFVLSVMVAALLRICDPATVTAGAIFAVFRYALMLIMGLDAVPRLVQQISQLRELKRRLA